MTQYVVVQNTVDDYKYLYISKSSETLTINYIKAENLSEYTSSKDEFTEETVDLSSSDFILIKKNYVYLFAITSTTDSTVFTFSFDDQLKGMKYIVPLTVDKTEETTFEYITHNKLKHSSIFVLLKPTTTAIELKTSLTENSKFADFTKKGFNGTFNVEGLLADSDTTYTSQYKIYFVQTTKDSDLEGDEKLVITFTEGAVATTDKSETINIKTQPIQSFDLVSNQILTQPQLFAITNDTGAVSNVYANIFITTSIQKAFKVTMDTTDLTVSKLANVYSFGLVKSLADAAIVNFKLALTAYDDIFSINVDTRSILNLGATVVAGTNVNIVVVADKTTDQVGAGRIKVVLAADATTAVFYKAYESSTKPYYLYLYCEAPNVIRINTSGITIGALDATTPLVAGSHGSQLTFVEKQCALGDFIIVKVTDAITTQFNMFSIFKTLPGIVNYLLIQQQDKTFHNLDTVIETKSAIEDANLLIKKLVDSVKLQVITICHKCPDNADAAKINICTFAKAASTKFTGAADDPILVSGIEIDHNSKVDIADTDTLITKMKDKNSQALTQPQQVFTGTVCSVTYQTAAADFTEYGFDAIGKEVLTTLIPTLKISLLVTDIVANLTKTATKDIIVYDDQIGDSKITFFGQGSVLTQISITDALLYGSYEIDFTADDKIYKQLYVCNNSTAKFACSTFTSSVYLSNYPLALASTVNLSVIAQIDLADDTKKIAETFKSVELLEIKTLIATVDVQTRANVASIASIDLLSKTQLSKKFTITKPEVETLPLQFKLTATGGKEFLLPDDKVRIVKIATEKTTVDSKLPTFQEILNIDGFKSGNFKVTETTTYQAFYEGKSVLDTFTLKLEQVDTTTKLAGEIPTTNNQLYNVANFVDIADLKSIYSVAPQYFSMDDKTMGDYYLLVKLKNSNIPLSDLGFATLCNETKLDNLVADEISKFKAVETSKVMLNDEYITLDLKLLKNSETKFCYLQVTNKNSSDTFDMLQFQNVQILKDQENQLFKDSDVSNNKTVPLKISSGDSFKFYIDVTDLTKMQNLLITIPEASKTVLKGGFVTKDTKYDTLEPITEFVELINTQSFMTQTKGQQFKLEVSIPAIKEGETAVNENIKFQFNNNIISIFDKNNSKNIIKDQAHANKQVKFKALKKTVNYFLFDSIRLLKPFNIDITSAAYTGTLTGQYKFIQTAMFDIKDALPIKNKTEGESTTLAQKISLFQAEDDDTQLFFKLDNQTEADVEITIDLTLNTPTELTLAEDTSITSKENLDKLLDAPVELSAKTKFIDDSKNIFVEFKNTAGKEQRTLKMTFIEPTELATNFNIYYQYINEKLKKNELKYGVKVNQFEGNYNIFLPKLKKAASIIIFGKYKGEGTGEFKLELVEQSIQQLASQQQLSKDSNDYKSLTVSNVSGAAQTLKGNFDAIKLMPGQQSLKVMTLDKIINNTLSSYAVQPEGSTLKHQINIIEIVDTADFKIRQLEEKKKDRISKIYTMTNGKQMDIPFVIKDDKLTLEEKKDEDFIITKKSATATPTDTTTTPTEPTDTTTTPTDTATKAIELQSLKSLLRKNQTAAAPAPPKGLIMETTMDENGTESIPMVQGSFSLDDNGSGSGFNNLLILAIVLPILIIIVIIVIIAIYCVRKKNSGGQKVQN